MLAQVTHVDVNLGLVGPHVLVDLAQEKLQSVDKLRVVCPYQLLVLLEFVLEVHYKRPEVLLVVQNQLGDDCFVDLCRGELILGILDDHGGKLGEVLGYLGRALLHDDDILVAELQQEVCVALDAGEEGLWLQLGRQLLLLRAFLVLGVGLLCIGVGLRVLRVAGCLACLGNEQLGVGT